MSNSFIKLDRRLVRVLGLNNAVVLCHLLGIQDAINSKRGKQDAIYQQQDRLIYDVGLSKATLIKSIKYLEDIKLLHTIKGTKGNKTMYLVNKYNLNSLSKMIDDLETNNTKKNKLNATSIKRDVLNLYQEWYKNNTTSSDNFSTTNKDLKEKKNNIKNNKSSSRQLLSNCIHQPITIDYLNDSVLYDSKTYQFIPLYFKDSYTVSDIYNVLNKSSNVNLNEHIILEYFLKRYFKYYGTLHKKANTPRVREILQTIHQVLEIRYINNDVNYLIDIIDEYFNTTNSKNRDLTIYLFLSKDDRGLYSWINTIAKRLGLASDDEF